MQPTLDVGGSHWQYGIVYILLEPVEAKIASL